MKVSLNDIDPFGISWLVVELLKHINSNGCCYVHTFMVLVLSCCSLKQKREMKEGHKLMRTAANLVKDQREGHSRVNHHNFDVFSSE